MTGLRAVLDCQWVPAPQESNGRSDNRVRAAIQQRARALAYQAPPLTAEQVALLRAVFNHRLGGGG